MVRLADRIKELRVSHNMTQEEFGKVFGVVKSTVSLYESGKSTPNDELKQRMCEYFKVSLDYLSGRTDYRDPVDETLLKNDSLDRSIRYWITRNGYGYAEIAEYLGISEERLNEYLKGETAPPYSVIYSLSRKLDISTDCLIGLRKKSRDPDLNKVLPFEYNYQIAERIRDLCKRKNTSISDLAMLLSLDEGEVYYMVEYGFIPHINTVISLADYFNISCDYLLCRIDDQSEKVLKSFQLLNEDNKDILVGEVKRSLRDQAADEYRKNHETLKEAT